MCGELNMLKVLDVLVRLTNQCRVCWVFRPRSAPVWVTGDLGRDPIKASCMRGKQSGSGVMEEARRAFDTKPSYTALESETVSETDVAQ